MTKFGKKHQKFQEMHLTDENAEKVLNRSQSWQAVSKQINKYENEPAKGSISQDIIFSGKVLQGGNFAGENFENADFSGSNMQEVNLAQANLQNVNFTGADLSGADLSGADLTGAVFSGAKLIGVNFAGAKMHGVKLVDADLQDAILLDADLDELAIEDLQELVEYLAKYYPYKLNLSRLNLSLLDLKRIDLRQVSLKGADLRGCDLTGINIFELDLSECLITPEQIAQAIGHMPTPDELAKILAPKKKNGKKKMGGIDFGDFFDSRGGFDWDVTKSDDSVDKLFKSGKEFIKGFKKGDKHKDVDDKKQTTEKDDKSKQTDVGELRKAIEEHKREVLEQRIEQQKSEQQREAEREIVKEKIHETKVQIANNNRER
ncbi:MAG: pentapeptide repeat-containing protein [Alphaproteobacteria bacterium]|nr:pentapeptide repeat-containing protein [Alphaproteobacteria bacterium]